MPPRWLSCIIVLCWLATTGWLFWHELWTRWLPGEPPRYQIDLVDEVQQKGRKPLQISWTVERQSKKTDRPSPVFHASTWVDYRKEEDLFTLNADLDATKDPKFQPVEMANHLIKIDRITSAYRVNRSGQLRSLEARVRVHFNWEPLSNLPPSVLRFLGIQPALFQKGPSSDPTWLRIWGEVRNRRFYAHCLAAAEPLGKPMELDLPPVEVSHTGSVLIPLHPLNHIRGLRLGQSWRQPLVDPLRDVLSGSSGVRWLSARVLPRPKLLELNDNQISCLVIEYTNDEDKMVGRTWIEQDGERVLQQEAISEDGRWIMKRNDVSRRKRLRSQDFSHD